MLVNEYLVVSAFVFCTQVQYPGLELQMKIDITTMSFLSKSVALVREEFFFFTSICLLHNVVVILSCNWIVAGSSHDYRKSFSACSLKNRKNGKRSFTFTYLCFQIKKWKTSFSKFRRDLKTILSFHYLLFLTKVLFSKWKQQFLLIKIVS